MRFIGKSIKKLPPNFETRRDVIARRIEMIRALKRGNCDALKLAAKLAKCANGDRCDLPICPVCVRRLRRSFVLGALACLDQLKSRAKLPFTAFSAVSSRDRYNLGQLHKLDIALINRRIQRQYQRAGFALVFSGIDISLNEDGLARKKSYWQVQVYGIVVGSGVDAVKSALKRLYLHAPSTPRPLRVRECSNLPKALGYAIKPAFVRRISYIDEPGRRNTRKCSLKAAQLRELALAFRRCQLPVRYALSGCRRYGNRIELNPGVRKRLEKLASRRDNGSN